MFLTVKKLSANNFRYCTTDIIHGTNPSYLVLCFEHFGDTLGFCHLFDKQFHPGIGGIVDLVQMGYQLAVKQQCGIICFPVLPEASMAHSAVLAGPGRFFFWEL